MSASDTEYKALAAIYGPGLSLQDMRLMSYGGPTVPAKSEEDLAFTYFAATGDPKNSRTDNEYKYWLANGGAANGSATDNKNTAGGTIITARTNLCKAPRAVDTPTDGWTIGRWFGAGGGAGTYSYVTGISGPLSSLTTARKKTWSAAPTNNADAGFSVEEFNLQHFAVTPGETYTASAYMRHVSGGAKAIRMTIQFNDALTSGNMIQRFNGDTLSALNSNTWYRVSVTATAPPGSVGMIVIPDLAGGAVTLAPGDTLEATGVLIEKVPSVDTYFDGSTPDTFTNDFSWTGTVDDSTSKATKTNNYANAVDPITQFPAAVHAIWAGDYSWVTGKPADGGNVSQLRNFGSVGGDPVNATGGEQPTYKAKDPKFNNQPSLTFGGAQYLVVDVPDIAVPWWMVAIGYTTVTTGTVVIAGNGVTTSGGLGRANSNNNWFINAANPTYSTVLADTLVHLLYGQVQAGATWCGVDAFKGPAGANPTNPYQMFRVGSGGDLVTASNKWQGGIVYIGVFTSDPTLDPKWANVLQFARNCGVAV